MNVWSSTMFLAEKKSWHFLSDEIQPGNSCDINQEMFGISLRHLRMVSGHWRSQSNGQNFKGREEAEMSPFAKDQIVHYSCLK